MSIISYYNGIILAGVNSEHTHTFSDKLQARNKLSFSCIVFSLIYVTFFFANGHFLPFLAIIFATTLFAISIVLNQFQKYTLSSYLILFNTNYCVLFFSTYLGFGSGIHLYLFTSPLIVLTLFDNKSILFISMAMMTYVLNFIILVLIEKVFKVDFLILNASQTEAFYIINIVLSSFILIMLSLYFFYNNNRVNQLLLLKNEELLYQQQLLKEENDIRKSAEEQAISSLSDREILLSEVHHRVNNNLAVVSALIELQSVYVSDEKTIQILKDSQNRIKSIALLHAKLYGNKSLQFVDVSSYVTDLIQFIKQSLNIKEKEIFIHPQIDEINLDMTKAMPFGLLLNELITNSYKYAFLLKDNGNIWINIFEENSEYILKYKDDGPGFEYDREVEKTSLGLNLIESFCTQLNGNFVYKCLDGEMIFQFKFPAQKN